MRNIWTHIVGFYCSFFSGLLVWGVFWKIVPTFTISQQQVIIHHGDSFLKMVINNIQLLSREIFQFRFPKILSHILQFFSFFCNYSLTTFVMINIFKRRKIRQNSADHLFTLVLVDAVYAMAHALHNLVLHQVQNSKHKYKTQIQNTNTNTKHKYKHLDLNI